MQRTLPISQLTLACHSFRAVAALVTATALERNNGPAPLRLFVSGLGPAHIVAASAMWNDLGGWQENDTARLRMVERLGRVLDEVTCWSFMAVSAVLVIQWLSQQC